MAHFSTPIFRVPECGLRKTLVFSDVIVGAGRKPSPRSSGWALLGLMQVSADICFAMQQMIYCVFLQCSGSLLVAVLVRDHAKQFVGRPSAE
jgi:hypothetical protein